MFSPEYYLTPYIASYLGKYVVNFNRTNFQVSLWQGDASFQNLDLNLHAIEEEISLPFRVTSGHIHELKISVPWTKITSEPIVIVINTLELSLGLKKTDDVRKNEGEGDSLHSQCQDDLNPNPSTQSPQIQTDPKLPNDTSGYMQGLLNRILRNIKIISYNVVIKYIEDDFVLSFNLQSMTLNSVNEHWQPAFIDMGGTDFTVRQKLMCPDLTVCLDSIDSILKNNFSDPIMNKCAFECRILSQFKGLSSRVPLLRRLDILFNDIDCFVLEEQIPRMVRLYNLCVALGCLKIPEQFPETQRKNTCQAKEKQSDSACVLSTVGTSTPTSSKASLSQNSASSIFSESSSLRIGHSNKNSSLVEVKIPNPNSVTKSDSDSGIVAALEAVQDCSEDDECIEEIEGSFSMYEWASWAVGWLPVPSILGSTENETEPQLVEDHETMNNIGLYIKSANVTMKISEHVCDNASTTSSNASCRMKAVPYLKCLVQGIVCDIAAQGTSASYRGGISRLQIDGVGYCPCGSEDCIEDAPEFPMNSNFGITYVEVGAVKEDFTAGSLYDTTEVLRSYICRFHCYGYEDIFPEEDMLLRTPGIGFDSIELIHSNNEGEGARCCLGHTDFRDNAAKKSTDSPLAFEDSHSKTATRVIIAPIQLKVSTSFIHRVTLIIETSKATDYIPYSGLMDLYIPDFRTYTKFRMDEFHCIFYDGDAKFIKDAENQIVMEIHGTKANSDAKGIYSNTRFQIEKLNSRTYQFAPPGSSKAAIAANITDVNGNIAGTGKYRGVLDSKTDFNMTVSALSMSTMIGDRTDILMNPWSMRLRVLSEWHSYIHIPTTTISFHSDPISIFFGPQHILALLQVYHTFGEYLRRFILAEEQEIVDILEALPSVIAERQFVDDLRSGMFNYVECSSTSYAPEPYQVIICRSQRTMTWCYPHPRSINSITAYPVPVLESTHKYSKIDLPVELTCEVSHWDEARAIFVTIGTFKVSETRYGKLEPISPATVSAHVASIWRITIFNPMEEDEINIILTPDGLVASLNVCSTFASEKVPKLSMYADVPHILVHFINHQTYAGKIPEDRLRMYSMDGLNNLLDQPFASLEVSRIKFNALMWMRKAAVSAGFKVQVNVVDYAYLTDIIVVDPFHIKVLLTYNECYPDKISEELNLISNPIIVKVGASTLHTIITSTLIWMQVLKAYYGDVVDTSKNHFQTRVNTTQILICNDTDMDLGVIQVDTNKPLAIRGRHCYAFAWTTQKAKSEIRLGFLEEGVWNWSSSFPLNRSNGTIVKTLRGKSFFVTTEHIYASQIMVTIYGCFSVANALDIPLEVGLLGTNGYKETIWTVDNQTYGPSRVHFGRDVAGLRFKPLNLTGGHHGWSHSLTMDELRMAHKQAKCIALYEEKNGDLIVLNIWCSLIEETVDGITRCVVFLSPVFRLLSLLSSPTIAKLSSNNDPPAIFNLPGRGSEIEIQYLGDETAAHLLTFQLGPASTASSPPIPLFPGGGPCVEKSDVEKRRIDDIFKDIVLDLGESRKRKQKWPFTREGFEVRQWLLGAPENPYIKVNLKPWIAGIPSVLIEAKPEAIFANLTGYTLLFREENQDICIPNRSAFSPKNIRGKFSFGFNCFSKYSSVSWSEEIQISNYQSPSDIHHVNADWKIPLECFSRLEINGTQTQIHVTIETHIYDEIIILTLRPTFNFQNRTKFPLSACGVSLYHNSVPKDDVLGLRDNYIELASNDSEVEPSETAVGLLSFNCDWDVTHGEIYIAGMKYIALRYANSPWWFVRLMKFESIFDNLSAPQGIPVKRIAVAIPSCQPHWAQGDLSELPEVTLALSLCWTCKNGQVWISIAVNENPQVVIVNESQFPLCYSEGLLGKHGPQVEYDHFPQFRCLAPRTTGFFAFPSLQEGFPEVMNTEPKAALIFGRPAWDYKVVLRLSMVCRDPNCIEWSAPVKCEDFEEYQLINFGEGESKVYLKVLAEKLGLTYYIYVEELSDAEVLARNVRSRITIGDSNNRNKDEFQEESASKVRFMSPLVNRIHRYDPSERNQILTPDELAVEMSQSQMALEFARPSRTQSHICINTGSPSDPFRCVTVHFPELRFIFTDDFNHLGQKREIVSLIVTDLCVRGVPQHGNKRLRVLKNKVIQTWRMVVQLGDVQVDNALFQEKLYDFPVLFKRNDTYYPLKIFLESEDENHIHEVIFDNFKDQQAVFRLSTEFLLTAPEALRRLLSMEIACQPFTLNIEDRFINFILPVSQNFTGIITERIALLRNENQILRTQRQEYHSKESMQVIFPRTSHPSTVSLRPPPILFTNNPNPVAHVGILSSRRLSVESIPSNPCAEAESPGLWSTTNEAENDSLRIHHSLPSTLTDTYDQLGQRSLYADIRAEYLGKREGLSTSGENEELENGRLGEEIVSERLSKECPSHRATYMPIPQEIVSIIKDLANPVQLQRIRIESVQTYLTFRGRYKGMYFAFDNSPILLNTYQSNYVITTMYTLGETFGNHYLLGAIYRAGNPMRLIGSMELLGSPGALARCVGSGFKDFFIYPVRGIRNGPMAFMLGINTGVSSLIRNVSSGTLTSVTNFAWSVSRNIDRLTLDKNEQLFLEETRRVPIDGISDGLVHGLTGFGIRLLGAIGGIAHHPIQAVMEEGASPLGIVTGFGKGLIGAVTKPVGATVELVAMTGQGLLQEAGWTNKLNRKYNVHVEDTWSCSNSLLRYRWNELEEEERKGYHEQHHKDFQL